MGRVRWIPSRRSAPGLLLPKLLLLPEVATGGVLGPRGTKTRPAA